ncbi:sulfate adenylyltransferase [Candidatus Poribacteria bacterium]|nr:sulfate adenylyltransferase [Candidatus Poribacteria bacterium]MYA56825.1 sulfate adenylyltransferase [Candidatus Poribacteria bacterium]
MIKPHGAETLNPLYVSDDTERAKLIKEAEHLPSVLVSSGAAASAVMLASGYFTPLTGYMNIAEATSVATDMKLSNGLFWPVPVMNIVPSAQLTDAVKNADRIALRDPNVEGNPPIAVMKVSAIETLSKEQKQLLIEKTFGTTDPEHPGVPAFANVGDTVLSGPIEVLNYSYFREDFPDTFRTAVEIREDIAGRGWDTVVAFQTRNPMHRAHEGLCKIAQEAVNADGILIHMLLGKLKPGDIPAAVRDACIRTMVEHYFPENTVSITGYGFDMLYAGPREALLHAVFRQNCGASHFIVGRDHAGAGDYYGAFDAQEIFDTIPEDALEIGIFRGDFTVWSKKRNKIIMMSDYPHDADDYFEISGTKLREMLAAGQPLPPEISRPEVAEILTAYYQSEANA